jgi:uroporphyrinogen decarboxylase
MIDIRPRPDFGRFLDTLLLRKAYRRPPLFDFHVDARHKACVIGREVATPADDVEFWRRAGYDYVQVSICVVPRELANAGNRCNAEGPAIISLDQFLSRRWSWLDASEGNLTCIQDQIDRLVAVAKALPGEMKILLHTADIFTFAWMLMGFTDFCFKAIEEPDLVAAVMDSLAAATLNAMVAAIDVAGGAAGVLFYSDDIAYTEGLMLSPRFFGDRLFPHIRRLVEIGQARGLPLAYHTDGRLYDVFDQLADIGVRGIQPLEPKSMDPLLIKRRWGDRFCLMGNIDLDLLARGDGEHVETEVRRKVETIGAGGGYMPGVSNTVPHYVRYANYKRMIETVYSLGD